MASGRLISLLLAVQAHHYLHIAECNENFTDVEGDLAAHCLNREPRKIRKLDQDVGSQSETCTDHEGCKCDVQSALHPRVHVVETAFQ